jgi:hypothetical protein
VKEENILRGLSVPVDLAEHYLISQIFNLISQCIEIATPSASYSHFENPCFTSDTGKMHLEGRIFELERMVCSALKKSTSIAFFIATCGEKVELLSKRLMKEGHSLEGLIVDLIGSEIAECTADIVYKKIESDVVSSGLHITNRYSPGYCNWPVSDQQKLFSLLGQNTCGVRLTPSSLMIPLKSVSGIVGIGEFVQFRGYACSVCNVDHCLYRDKN